MTKRKKREKNAFDDDEICKVPFVFDGDDNRYQT